MNFFPFHTGKRDSIEAKEGLKDWGKVVQTLEAYGEEFEGKQKAPPP